MTLTFTGDPAAISLWLDEPPFAFAHAGPEETTSRPLPLGIEGPNRGVSGVSDPKLYVHYPEHPCGAAMVICPGGAYRYLEIDKEGHEIARWLTGLGLVAAVLKYRTLPDAKPEKGQKSRKYMHRAILADGLQAIRLVRAHAASWGVSPTRIGAMGFSAGGHMVTSLATMWREPAHDGRYAEISARPDFVAPIYPAVPAPLASMVDSETPPTFMAVADDDSLVPPEHCLRLYRALKKAHVTAELHIYRSGGHGFALRAGDSPAAGWRGAFEAWLASIGMLGAL